MGTALIYLVIVLGVAAVFFVGASAVFGRGEELAPIPPGATPTWLPEHELSAVDVRDLRFQQALRGYKMAEVDWALERLAVELERLAGERDELRRRLGELKPIGDAPGGGPAAREADDVAATDTVTNGAAGTGAAAEEGTT